MSGNRGAVGQRQGMNSSVEFTTYTYNIGSIPANAILTDSVTPTNKNYELVGAVGYTIIKSSGLVSFRIYVDEGSLNIGLKNISSNTIENKQMKITLMWQRA